MALNGFGVFTEWSGSCVDWPAKTKLYTLEARGKEGMSPQQTATVEVSDSAPPAEREKPGFCRVLRRDVQCR